MNIRIAIMTGGFLAALSMTAVPLRADPSVTVHRTPTCGCCGAWVDHLRADGFDVTVRNHDPSTLDGIKERLGIPRAMQSCHTAVVEGYTVEGHVPAADIRRLLDEKPEVAGIAVPGMPIGSPGMEMGDRKEPYAVLTFGDGEPEVFARH